MLQFDSSIALDLLRIDTFERKTQQWNLSNLKSVFSGNPEKKPILNIPIYDVLIYGLGGDFIHTRSVDMDKTEKKLKEDYPLLDTILGSCERKIVLAGGCIIRAMQGQHKKTDADFFFIGLTKEEIQSTLEFLWDTIFEPLGAGCVRNLKTTTFIVEEPKEEGRRQKEDPLGGKAFGTRYQFIHSRSYPTPAHVVGGFDLTIAACFYDGTDFYTTTLGAWSLKFWINVIDPARRSTTYEERLRKYATDLRVHLVFPFFNKKMLVEASGAKTALLKDVKYEILPGLELMVWYSGNFNILATETRHEVKIGDYGPIATGYCSVDFFNAVLASRGKWDLLSWYGEDKESIFETPDVNTFSGMRSGDFVRSEVPHNGHLVMWLGMERAAEIREMDEEQQEKEWHKEAKAIKRRVKKAVRQLEDYIEEHGVHYLGPNENPGRQGDVWTSSFNPIQEDIRKYYPKGARINQLFIPNEVAFLLKCAMGVTYTRDTFSHILSMVAREMALKACDRVQALFDAAKNRNKKATPARKARVTKK